MRGSLHEAAMNKPPKAAQLIISVLYNAGKAGDGKAGLSKSAWISQKNWQDVEVGDYIVVKCIKEPYGSKGPKVTAQLSLPGRFVVRVKEQGFSSWSSALASPTIS